MQRRFHFVKESSKAVISNGNYLWQQQICKNFFIVLLFVYVSLRMNIVREASVIVVIVLLNSTSMVGVMSETDNIEITLFFYSASSSFLLRSLVIDCLS